MTCFGGLEQIYHRYHRSKSRSDVRIGSVKMLLKKKVKRIYLNNTDDRGVGSENLLAYFSRNSWKKGGNNYNPQKSSSKCVGDSDKFCNRKLSPITQTRSITKSLKNLIQPPKNVDMSSNTDGKNIVSIATQVGKHQLLLGISKRSPRCNESKLIDVTQELNHVSKSPKTKTQKKFLASDSLVEHVCDTEFLNVDRDSRLFLDLMKNNPQRHNRKLFAFKIKNKKLPVKTKSQDLKSAIFLRKRFEALKKGFTKREDSNKNIVIVNKLSNETSRSSHEDVLTTSDPPSLEGRSYSNMKTYNQFYCDKKTEDRMSKNNSAGEKLHITEINQSSCFDWQNIGNQGFDNMCRLREMKFNLKEDYHKKYSNPVASFQTFKSSKKSTDIKMFPGTQQPNKKDRRRFFVFKKKTKEEPKLQLKSKNNVTAGRCELRNCFRMKIAKNTPPNAKNKTSHLSDEALWKSKYLIPNIDSKNNVHIKWNNESYLSRSSTVLKLIDTVLKQTEMVYGSRSEITTGESSYYTSYTQNVTYAPQMIEAWMTAKALQSKPKQLPNKIKNSSTDDVEVPISNRKLFINKSKAFSQKIDAVLHSNNVKKSSKESSSSEYFRIDVPKSFYFESTSSDEYNKTQSSEEKIYNIVEYEAEFDSRKSSRAQKDFEMGDYKENDIEVIVSLKSSKDYESNLRENVVKKPPAYKDVLTQASHVNLAKKCDIINVGIIGPRGLRNINKPIMRIPEGNIERSTKMYEFAESYLQDYYRNWTPLGIDFLSWCLSDLNIICCSEKATCSFHKQGDGSKSCPNIYDHIEVCTAVSTSDGCTPFPDTPDVEGKKNIDDAYKLLEENESDVHIWPHEFGKRIIPKDSLAVLRRRQIYATSNKSKWVRSNDSMTPNSITNVEDKEARNTMAESTELTSEVKPKKKTAKKHVSMADCEVVEKKIFPAPLNSSDVIPSASKKDTNVINKKLENNKYKKHTITIKKSVFTIPDIPCTECVKNIDALSSKQSLQSADSFVCEFKSKNQPAFCNAQPPSKKSVVSKTLPETALSSEFLSKSPTDKEFSHYVLLPRCKSPVSKLIRLTSCKACKPLTSNKYSPAFEPAKLFKLSSYTTSSTQQSFPKTRSSSPSSTPTPLFHYPKLLQATKKCSPICTRYYNSCMNHTLDQPSPTTNKEYFIPKDLSSSIPPCRKKVSSINKPNNMCSQTPPYEKSQSSQITPKHSPLFIKPRNQSSATESQNKCTSHCFPERNSCLTNNEPIDSRCVTNRKEMNSPPHSTTCKIPPRQTPSPTKHIGNKYSLPLKNHELNQSSLNSIAKNHQCRPSPKKNFNECQKNYPLLPDISNQSLIRRKKKNKHSRWKPECIKMPKTRDFITNPSPLISPQASTCPPPRSSSTSSRPKISGLYIKMKPTKKKTYSKDCLIRQNNKNGHIVKLNSIEKINITLNEETLSEENVRAGKNFKVQDLNGKTLYERREYRKRHPTRVNTFLGRFYKPSNINMVSTPMTPVQERKSHIKNKSVILESKSDASVEKYIKAQFKVNVDQENSIDINIDNVDGENINQNSNNTNNIEQQQNVFVNMNKNSYNENIAAKDDAKRQIKSNNYKPHVRIDETDKNNQKFAKRFSEKFQTVSSGYNYEYPEDSDKTHSNHRDRIDLPSTTEISKIQIYRSDELTSIELAEPEFGNLNVSANSTSQYENTVEKESTDGKSITSKRDSTVIALKVRCDPLDDDSKLVSDPENEITNMNTSTIESSRRIESSLSMKEKREMLRNIFEKANTKKLQNRCRNEQLRDMLKTIMTSDSSALENIAVSSNELVEDSANVLLKPNYLCDVHSKSNNYKIDCNVSEPNRSKYYLNEQMKCECNTTSKHTPEVVEQRCMCNKLAEKLKLCFAGGRYCFFREPVKINVETSCNLLSKEEFQALKFSSNKIGVATHSCNYVENGSNSANPNVKNLIGSGTTKNTSTVLAQYEGSINSKEVNVGSDCQSAIESIKNDSLTFDMTIQSCGDDIVNTHPMNLPKDDMKVRKSIDKGKQKHCKKETNENLLENSVQEADILQSYKIKKAVLEIYTEKSKSKDGEYLLAKLPKFVNDSVVEILNRDLAFRNHKRKKNIVMMSIQR